MCFMIPFELIYNLYANKEQNPDMMRVCACVFLLFSFIVPGTDLLKR